MRNVAVAIATTLGVGYIPFAPGTFGSAAGLLLWWLLPQEPLTQFLVCVVLFVVGAWSATAAESHFGRNDPGPVVIDEVMGMLITLLGVPVSWPGALLAFFIFRLFDVIKPYPANRLEALHGGTGIMADDAMAAVYGNLALRAIIWLTVGRVAW